MRKLIEKFGKKNTLSGKKGRGKLYGRFLKMIDNLQTPKHKTNHKYRSRFPLLKFYLLKIKPTIKSIANIRKGSKREWFVQHKNT